MKKITIAFLMGSMLLLSACATTVKPTYVSPTQYQALNCQQLQAEYNRIQQHLDEGVPTAKRTGVGVGLGLGGGWSHGGRYWDGLSYMQDNNQVFQVWMDSKRLIQLP
jgi:hypothetical protein